MGILLLLIIPCSAFVPSTISYEVSEMPPSVSTVSDLGEKFTVGFTLNNDGPSPIYNATIALYLPLRSAETGSNYFLYPVNVDVSQLLQGLHSPCLMTLTLLLFLVFPCFFLTVSFLSLSLSVCSIFLYTTGPDNQFCILQQDQSSQ